IFSEIQDDYAHIGESRIPWPPEPTPETVTADEMESSGYFDSVHTSLYVWPVRYDAHRYLACFNTFSGHIAMDATKRDYLYLAIRARLQNRPDGSLTRHWAPTRTAVRRRDRLGRSALHREQALEDFPVMHQCQAEVLGRSFLAASPLL